MVAVTGPYHGLGNRMRVVLGAQALARLEGRSFRYVWPIGRGFGARLDELWEFHARRWPTALSRALQPSFPYRDAGLAWIDDAARQERVWQIRTPHALALPPGAPSWHASLRALQPVEGIRRRILELSAASADRPYLGVMIRAHTVAHDATLRESPVEWYLSRIEQIRTERPDLGLYVAADTDAAFVQVARRFPDCVGQTDKGPYNGRRGAAGRGRRPVPARRLLPHPRTALLELPRAGQVPLGEQRGPRDVDVVARNSLRGAGRADRRNAVAARASEPGPQLTIAESRYESASAT